MSELRDEITKKLGFGCMRLPVVGGDTSVIDDAAFCRMIDTYLERGFTYFDTAYPYHNGKSEEAVGRCLVDRYPRERFLLATKMPVWLVKETSDYDRLFAEQLARCKVSYFDFYLLHALNRESAAAEEQRGGFDFIRRMKEEGKIRHIGFSFHDSAEALEEILKAHPEMEFVQLQINYYDWESKKVQSGKCYETAVKYGVPVIVMEPVKGGTLANMTGEAAHALDALFAGKEGAKPSYASYAVRYAASLDNVFLVLSGMSDEAQLLDNTSYMQDFCPLAEEEQQAVEKAVEELAKLPVIPCTKCRYCVDDCPKQIPIPELFEDYNMTVRFGVNEINRNHYAMHVKGHGSAADCIKCGKCEGHCPQHLGIRKLLETVAGTFGEVPKN